MELNPWSAYARFLMGSFMHVERTNKRGVVKNIHGKPILNAGPERIPKFNEEQNTKVQEYTTIMKTKELWTIYTGPFHKEGDGPEASNIGIVYRALWLPPTITFEVAEKDAAALTHANLLYEAMPFSTSSSLQAVTDYLYSGSAFKKVDYVPHIFVFQLETNKDAYIDALASYNSHKTIFNRAGFQEDAVEQLNKQKEITLYPGAFVVLNNKMVDGIRIIYVGRRGTSWIIERGGLEGGAKQSRRKRKHTTRKVTRRAKN